MKPLADLTPAQLARAIERADVAHFALCDEMIAAGRGHERPTETRGKTDPLSLRLLASFEACAALSAERARRLAWGGNTKRIRAAA